MLIGGTFIHLTTCSTSHTRSALKSESADNAMQEHKVNSPLPICSEMHHRDNCGKGSADSKSLKIQSVIILFNSTVQCEKFP